MMVTRESATRIGLDDKFHNQLPIDTDHSGLVKFSSRFQHLYPVVWPRIERLVDTAHAAILGRFAVDKCLPNQASLSWIACFIVRQVERGVQILC